MLSPAALLSEALGDPPHISPCKPSLLLGGSSTPSAPPCAHPFAPPTGIPQLVAALQGGGKAVFLVSGGFRQVIHPIAQQLGIPLDHVYANQLLFKVGRWGSGAPIRVAVLSWQ